MLRIIYSPFTLSMSLFVALMFHVHVLSVVLRTPSVLKHCASYRYAHSLLVRYRSLFGCPHYLYCIVHALYIRCTHIIVLCTRLCSLYRSHSRVYSLHSLDTQVFAPCLVTIRYTHVSSTDETCVDLKVLNVSMCGT
jgi:hypothetical protein